MKYLSLFSGIGGFEYAIHQVFQDAECVGYSEIDKFAIQTYQKNFPTHVNLGDITDIEIGDLPDFDLLVGGSPCQDLSIAGRKKGLSGERSGLFYKYLEILRTKKPKYFILENVASMKQEERDKITSEVGVEPIMINASLVSAQTRKRLYWTNIPGIQQPSDRNIVLKDILQYGAEVDDRMVNIEGKAYTLTASYNGAIESNSVEKKQRTMVRVGQFGKGGQGERIYSVDGKSVNLSAQSGGVGGKTGLYLVAPNGKNMVVNSPELQVFVERRTEEGKRARREIRKSEGRDSTLRSKDHKEYVGKEGLKSNCITTSPGVEGMIVKDYTVRKLTPTECERLQCFPDGRTEGVSNTQRYKQLGNAVNTEIIKHILSYIPANG